MRAIRGLDTPSAGHALVGGRPSVSPRGTRIGHCWTQRRCRRAAPAAIICCGWVTPTGLGARRIDEVIALAGCRTVAQPKAGGCSRLQDRGSPAPGKPRALAAREMFSARSLSYSGPPRFLTSIRLTFTTVSRLRRAWSNAVRGRVPRSAGETAAPPRASRMLMGLRAGAQGCCAQLMSRRVTVRASSGRALPRRCRRLWPLPAVCKAAPQL